MRTTMLALALCVPTAAHAEDGALLFKTYCSTCHGESGKGDGVAAAALNTKPRDFTAPDLWHLCQVPIGGTLISSSVELMRRGKYIPPWVQERLGALGLKPDDIDHYIFHQPSEVMVRKILSDIGVDPEKGVYTHALYGNTASASIGVTYRQLLEDRRVKIGDKLVLGSAAAGYSMVMATGEWTGHST